MRTASLSFATRFHKQSNNQKKKARGHSKREWDIQKIHKMVVVWQKTSFKEDLMLKIAAVQFYLKNKTDLSGRSYAAFAFFPQAVQFGKSCL